MVRPACVECDDVPEGSCSNESSQRILKARCVSSNPVSTLCKAVLHRNALNILRSNPGSFSQPTSDAGDLTDGNSLSATNLEQTFSNNQDEIGVEMHNIAYGYTGVHVGNSLNGSQQDSVQTQPEIGDAGLMVGGYHTTDAISNSGTELLTGNQQKLVFSHSKFGPSPFELSIYHPDVPRNIHMGVSSWFKDTIISRDELLRPWVKYEVPFPLCIIGSALKEAFMEKVVLTVDVVDAIMVLFTKLDDWMYDTYANAVPQHNRWRYFLGARFAYYVLNGQDYLESERIKSITYAVEHCQMIVIPVFRQNKWSCYFWDFKQKRITVLDPCVMNLIHSTSGISHENTVALLHNALFACINKYFHGWKCDQEGWSRSYPIDIGPRSIPRNSGFYTVHYAKAFDGVKLDYNLLTPIMVSKAD
ncbi:hypothetical protein ACP4OV_026331 [Aristida adscensionis]